MADSLENNKNTKPNPDPTVATNDAVERAVKAERDYVKGEIKVLVERLDNMDKATKVLSETVTRVPTDVTKEVSHLRELLLEKFNSIETQFKERDTRSERESRDNKTAVDAAFAAQKEAAAEQNKSNTLAIDKSEKATAETLTKQADLFKSTTDALQSQVTDLKDRVGKSEASKTGGQDNAAASRANVAMIISIIIGLITVFGFMYASS